VASGRSAVTPYQQGDAGPAQPTVGADFWDFAETFQVIIAVHYWLLQLMYNTRVKTCIPMQYMLSKCILCDFPYITGLYVHLVQIQVHCC
jgi:hypothetical protein